MLERFAGRAAASRHHGQRVVQGQRLMQVDGDIFLGWLRGGWADEHAARLLRPPALGLEARRRGGADVARAPDSVYATLCGWTLARAHARSGDRVAIAAYLGSGRAFDGAAARFAERYADQNEHDHAALVEAARAGRIAAGPGG